MKTSIRHTPCWTQSIVLFLDDSHPVFGDEVTVEVDFKVGGSFEPGRGDVDRAVIDEVRLPDGTVYSFTSREEDRILEKAKMGLAA